MDFGHILEEWESGKVKKRKKITQEKKMSLDSSKVEKDSSWFLHAPIPNDYVLMEKEAPYQKKSRKAVTRKNIENRSIEAVLDLHGKTEKEARSSLTSFIQQQQQKGVSKVLIIHGIGKHSPWNPEASSSSILKEMVQKWPSEMNQYVSHWGLEKKNPGATWYYLKSK